MESMYGHVKSGVKTKTTSQKRCTPHRSGWTWSMVRICFPHMFVSISMVNSVEDITTNALYMISDFIGNNSLTHLFNMSHHCLESQPISSINYFRLIKAGFLPKTPVMFW